jgi:hypothetical protein
MTKSMRIRWAGSVGHMEKNDQRNWPLGRPRHRWEDNIEMDLK